MGEITGDVFSVQVSASRSASLRRIERNKREAKELALNGYNVEQNLHNNGAYFATKGKSHVEHEKEVGRIFAENGFSFTLDTEKAKMTLPNGETFFLPSVDGRVHGFTHEISALNGTPDPRNVTDAITHSRKVSKKRRDVVVQANIAITFSPIGSGITREHIAKGVKEYRRLIKEGQTKAKPIMYLHVDEANRKVYYWDIKGHKKKA